MPPGTDRKTPSRPSIAGESSPTHRRRRGSPHTPGPSCAGIDQLELFGESGMKRMREGQSLFQVIYEGRNSNIILSPVAKCPRPLLQGRMECRRRVGARPLSRPSDGRGALPSPRAPPAQGTGPALRRASSYSSPGKTPVSTPMIPFASPQGTEKLSNTSPATCFARR